MTCLPRTASWTWVPTFTFCSMSNRSGALSLLWGRSLFLPHYIQKCWQIGGVLPVFGLCYRVAVLWRFWQAVWTYEGFAHRLPFVVSLGDGFAGQLNERPVIQDDGLIDCICTGDWLDVICLCVWVIDYLTEWVVKDQHSAGSLWPDCSAWKLMFSWC